MAGLAGSRRGGATLAMTNHFNQSMQHVLEISVSRKLSSPVKRTWKLTNTDEFRKMSLQKLCRFCRTSRPLSHETKNGEMRFFVRRISHGSVCL